MSKTSPKTSSKAVVPPGATEDRIVAAAAELLTEVGFSNVSTRMVANRAGVTTGSVHYHFGSMPELLVTASFTVLAAELGEVTRLLAEAPDLRSGMAATLDWLAGVDVGSPSMRVALEAMMEGARNPDVRPTMQAVLAEYRAGVAARARDEGRGDEADGLAILLPALLDGVLLHLMLDPGLDLAAARDVLDDLLTEDRP